jgi:NAD+ synthetase
VGILCKFACDNTLGIIMPCASKRNFEMDKNDGMEVAEHFGIQTRLIDLTPVREAEIEQLKTVTGLTELAVANIAPRLRMTTLYAVAASENRLVAGTGNRSEAYMGYFTKWGDGAHDFNPIADLTVTEIYEFLKWLAAPALRHRQGALGRTVRRPDRRKRNGRDLCRHRQISYDRRGRRARQKDNRKISQTLRAQENADSHV